MVRAPSPTTQALRRGGSSAAPGTGVASGRHEQRPLEGPLVPPRRAASRACEIRTLSSQACRSRHAHAAEPGQGRHRKTVPRGRLMETGARGARREKAGVERHGLGANPTFPSYYL